MATTVKEGTEQLVDRCSAMVRDVLRLPARNVWIDYDEQADVLYLSFRRPQRATRTIEVGEDILVRKDGKSVVGVTILNASAHQT
ncbi:MAG: DUF2283 domain-containing protein [bacterium]